MPRTGEAGVESRRATPRDPAVRLVRAARTLVVLLGVVAAVELVFARGTLFLRHERLRAGLPRPTEWWFGAGTYVTTFAGLLAAAAIVALGLRLALSRFPAAGRGLGLGFSVTIGALGVTALFLPPEVRGIMTIHLAVLLGGMILGLVALLSPASWEAKAFAAGPLLLPLLGTMALVSRGDTARVVASAALWSGATVVAFVGAGLALRRGLRAPRPVLLVAAAHALAVGCLAAGATLAQPRRAVEFLLFSHGFLVEFRGALALIAVVVVAVAFASAVLVLAPRDADRGGAGNALLGWGLLLSFLAGPTPLCATQSLVLAAGSLALIVGVLEERPPEAALEAEG